MEYERLKLLGKSVYSYKKAISKGNTLANVNIARLYLEKGFYDEAENILNQAVEKKDHHENVDYYLNYLKASIEKEGKDEESFLKGAQECREFILDYAQAIAIPFNNYEAITGLWITDYNDLKEFKIQYVSPNILIGEHDFKFKSAIPYRRGLLDFGDAYSAAKQETKTRKKKITFSGKIINRGLKYSIKVSSDSESLLTSASRTEFTGFGILSQDNQEIKFIVKKEGEFEYFTAKKSVRM